MNQTGMNQNEAVQRFDTALGELERHLTSVFAKDNGETAAGALKEQIKFLTEERDQLLAELEAERARIRRLKAANEEVSGRLDVVMGTLKDMVPGTPV